MMSVSPVVKKETARIAVGVIVLSAVMVGVFMLCGKFDPSVAYGALLGAAYAILNFFLMAYTIQKSTQLTETKAKTRIQISYTLRTLLMLAVGIAGVTLRWFHWLAVILPFVFPRITIYVMQLLKIADPISKQTEQKNESEGGET